MTELKETKLKTSDPAIMHELQNLPTFGQHDLVICTVNPKTMTII